MMVTTLEYNKSPAAFMMFSIHFLFLLEKKQISLTVWGIVKEWLVVLPSLMLASESANGENSDPVGKHYVCVWLFSFSFSFFNSLLTSASGWMLA